MKQVGCCFIRTAIPPAPAATSASALPPLLTLQSHCHIIYSASSSNQDGQLRH